MKNNDSLAVEAVTNWMYKVQSANKRGDNAYLGQLSSLKKLSTNALDTKRSYEWALVSEIISKNGWEPYSDTITRTERIAAVVLGLYATQFSPKNRAPYRQGYSFGKALAQLKRKAADEGGINGINMAIRGLIESPDNGLMTRRMLSVVSRMGEISFDYGELMTDLLNMDDARQKTRVLFKWAREQNFVQE